jgi:hypothetical protein
VCKRFRVVFKIEFFMADNRARRVQKAKLISDHARRSQPKSRKDADIKWNGGMMLYKTEHIASEA